jgi:arginyl-tRNA synthetase
MKKVRFGNKNALRITSSSIINIIKKNIKDIGTFHITGKYYNFLNKSNISNITSKNFLCTVNTYGKKHVLFLTKINGKNYSVFINKKNEIMILSQFKFDESLFEGTLFDGELVRKSDGKWIYFINDMAYFKGISVITKTFKERRDILHNLYKKMFENDNKISICKVELKEIIRLRITIRRINIV